MAPFPSAAEGERSEGSHHPRRLSAEGSDPCLHPAVTNAIPVDHLDEASLWSSPLSIARVVRVTRTALASIAFQSVSSGNRGPRLVLEHGRLLDPMVKPHHAPIKPATQPERLAPWRVSLPDADRALASGEAQLAFGECRPANEVTSARCQHGRHAVRSERWPRADLNPTIEESERLMPHSRFSCEELNLVVRRLPRGDELGGVLSWRVKLPSAKGPLLHQELTLGSPQTLDASASARRTSWNPRRVIE